MFHGNLDGFGCQDGIIYGQKGEGGSGSDSGLVAAGTFPDTAIDNKITKYKSLVKAYKQLIQKQQTLTTKKSHITNLKLSLSNHPTTISTQEQQLLTLKNTLTTLKKSNIVLQNQANSTTEHLIQELKEIQNQIESTEMKKKKKEEKETEKKKEEKEDKEGKEGKEEKEGKEMDNILGELREELRMKIEEKGNIEKLILQENQKLNSVKKQAIQAKIHWSYIINDLQNQKSFIENQIQDTKQQLQFLQQAKPIRTPNPISSTISTLTQQLTQSKHTLSQLEKISISLQEQLNQSTAYLHNEKQKQIKISTKIDQLRTLITIAVEGLGKNQKEEHEKRGKLSRLIEIEKGLVDKEILGRVKIRNEGLKGKLEIAKKKHQDQFETIEEMMAPRAFEKLTRSVNEVRDKYLENKLVPDKLKLVVKQFQELEKESEQLKWEGDPTIRDLDEKIKNWQQEISQLEQQIRTIQKQSEKMTKILNQYINQYPQFQITRLRQKKSSLSIKKQSKQQSLQRTMSKKTNKKKSISQQKNLQQQLDDDYSVSSSTKIGESISKNQQNQNTKKKKKKKNR